MCRVGICCTDSFGDPDDCQRRLGARGCIVEQRKSHSQCICAPDLGKTPKHGAFFVDPGSNGKDLGQRLDAVSTLRPGVVVLSFASRRQARTARVLMLRPPAPLPRASRSGSSSTSRAAHRASSAALRREGSEALSVSRRTSRMRASPRAPATGSSAVRTPLSPARESRDDGIDIQAAAFGLKPDT